MPGFPINAKEPPWRRLLAAWNGFWFMPRDPTLLGLIRIATGAVTCYTILMYLFTLQDFLGPDGWLDQKAIEEQIHDRPIRNVSLSGAPINVFQPPANADEQAKVESYQKNHAGALPLPPYPQSQMEAKYCDDFHDLFNFDLRTYGLPPPQDQKQWNEVVSYARKWDRPMPPPYPTTNEEAEWIDEYLKRYDVDPRLTYARGMPVFSFWIHLQNPFWMAVAHALFVTAALLFTLGFGTRVTGFLTWFAALNYIHRNTLVVFGVDTMMTILLFYLMIGPSGAALSLDRWLARWWKGRRTGQGIASPEPPQPSVAANVAIRLLQIHLCIIYGMAGLSKLTGSAWWAGTALWGVLGNYEFAPMNWALYNWLLHTLGSNQLLWEVVMTGGCYFTLAFELLYAVWIWRPNTRWIMLSAAVLLHGVIGLFMGLQTFALIMLVMNMGFLRDSEVQWILAQMGLGRPGPKKVIVPPEQAPPAPTPSEVAPPERPALAGSTHVVASK